MLFNSFHFVNFFIIVFVLYFLARRSHRAQNILLLVASYYFYSCWDWRFTGLLFLTTAIDYFIALKMRESKSSLIKKRWLFVSLVSNLGTLFFFKYFNFFAATFEPFVKVFGFDPGFFTLNVILPVGISFYTFQSMSYTLDVYLGNLEPTSSFVDFALFVSFFPQLVAGPIERATNLLPQIISYRRKITFNDINSGSFYILWGFYKKVVVADNLAIIANNSFSNYTTISGTEMIWGVVAFSFQIYGDFSGYSDIARGVAKLMGFDLMVNFRNPFFAQNPSDFWRRWHISLSEWFRDYVYIPLGGNRMGFITSVRNIFITMLLAGIWHGANWTFIIWGGFHAALLTMHRLLSSMAVSSYEKTVLKSLGKIGNIVLMYLVGLVGWTIFRAESLTTLVLIFQKMLSFTSSPVAMLMVVKIVVVCLPLIIVEAFQEISGDPEFILNSKPLVRGIVFSISLALIIILGTRVSNEFIYFQF